MSKEPERHGMKGWGMRLGADMQEPKTMEEAQLLATMTINDKLYELVTILQDLQARMTRLEVFVEETIPAYSRTSAYRTPYPGDREVAFHTAITGKKYDDRH
jgi:hypothetical protein